MAPRLRYDLGGQQSRPFRQKNWCGINPTPEADGNRKVGWIGDDDGGFRNPSHLARPRHPSSDGTLALPDLRVADNLLNFVTHFLVGHPVSPTMQPELHAHIDPGDADDGGADIGEDMQTESGHRADGGLHRHAESGKCIPIVADRGFTDAADDEELGHGFQDVGET